MSRVRDRRGAAAATARTQSESDVENRITKHLEFYALVMSAGAEAPDSPVGLPKDARKNMEMSMVRMFKSIGCR
jgi:hypothetical protein